MGRAAEALEKLYREWSPGSGRLIERARRVMPGGDTRATAHYPPYPLFIREGRGARVRDVDGHQLLDLMNNFTSLIHGHAHAGTLRAVREQIERGSAYAAPTESQVALAEEICARVPSIEELRFTSSGSEATNLCIRAARAFTGRARVMKAEGGYHGSHELGEISLIPLPGKAGPPDAPEPLAPDRSIVGGVLDDVVVTPWNAPQVTEAQLERHGDEIAALIVEPMLGGSGMIPPLPGYLRTLRELCDRAEVLLIFDEVVTLRVARGGMQEREGVIPDLTSLGKIIGGGLPIGAFGGRRDLLEQFNPDARGRLLHGSTFSGNPLSMAAGLAALADLTDREIARINALGDRLRAGLAVAFRRAGLRGAASGVGSLTMVHFGEPCPRDARASLAARLEAGPLRPLLHLGLLRRGVFGAGSLMYCTSTAMAEPDIELALEAFEAALLELRPVADQDAPHLLL